jgi:hypothetical protein
MASDVYANAKLLAATDQLEWVDSGVVFRGLLVDSAYTFNHVQTYVSDISASEVSGGTYARVNVVGRVATLDLPGNRALCDATNPLFPLLTGVTPSGLIVYKQVGGDDLTPGNDPLIVFVDFPDTSTNGNNFLVEFDPDGVFALTFC